MSGDDRAQVFASIRAALARRKQPKTQRPLIHPERLVATHRLAGSTDPWDLFARNFTRVRGSACRSLDELNDLLKKNEAHRGYCDPALRTTIGDALAARGFRVTYEFRRSEVDELSFGITPAVGAIAETGTLVLNDRTTSNRLGALAPWVHVAAVRAAAIHRTLGDAISSFDDDPNIIFVTGPSKTADVEGILIEGVHGPGVQGALLVD